MKYFNLFLGTAGSVAFDVMPTSSLEEMLTSVPGASGSSLASYDETALAYNAFRVLRTMVIFAYLEILKFLIIEQCPISFCTQTSG